MSDVRQVFLAVTVLFALAMAVPLLHETGGDAAGAGFQGAAGAPLAWHSEAGKVAAQHGCGQADFGECHVTAGPCGPATPALAMEHGSLAVDRPKHSPRRIGDAWPAGMRPLPLLPPPEQA